MSLEENKAIVRRFSEEVLSKGNLTVVDELFSKDVIDHNPATPDQTSGIEGVRQTLAMLREALPDMKCKIEDMIAEGDKVAMRSTTSGTHKGPLMGIPATGKQMTTTTFVIFRIKDGKITERWAQGDRLGMLQQLGIM
jgi:steroid delta-isomerase-like uncharacterized protein